MSSFAMFFGVLLSVAALSTVVIGDINHKLKVRDMKFKNNANKWFGDWSGSFKDTKKSSKLNVKFTVKEELPSDMELHMIIKMDGQDPIEQTMTLAEAMKDKAFGEDFVKAGNIPEVVGAADYNVVDYIASMQAVPAGTECGMKITADIGMPGEDPCVSMAIDATVGY